MTFLTQKITKEETLKRVTNAMALNKQISAHNRRRRELKELLLENGVSSTTLRKSTSLAWMEQKAEELGVLDQLR